MRLLYEIRRYKWVAASAMTTALQLDIDELNQRPPNLGDSTWQVADTTATESEYVVLLRKFVNTQP